jgi:anhydro-N-acetylmuramic acid kinase
LVIRLGDLRAKPSRVVAGLMTGTSLDGLDIALCRVQAGVPRGFDLLGHASEPMPGDLKAGLSLQGELSVAAAARLGRRLGEWYAEATCRLATRAGHAVDLVGMHGQTVFHEHEVATVQLGEPAFLALRLGCPVVAGFRQNDIAAGGCGAPLVPIVDLWLFGREGQGIVTLNLGGISNISALRPTADGGVDVAGFDCGPGNMVLDELARRFSGGAWSCDQDGAMAAAGRPRQDWLDHLLADPFFATPPPRSAGREQFGSGFVDRLLEATRPANEQDRCDLMATAVELTVRPVIDGLERFVAPRSTFTRLIVAGGGVRNPVLMRRLAELAEPLEVEASDALGLPSDLKEAIAFALLASARVDEIPANLPSVTGANRQVLLGNIVEA